MSAPISIQIVPALPGFYMFISDDESKTVYESAPIVAWRVETYQSNDGRKVFSECTPLSLEGEPVENYIGTLNPDGSVTVLSKGTFANRSEVRKFLYE